MQTAYRAVDTDEIGRALREVESVVAYDDALQDIVSGLADAESILNDLNRSISDYMNDMEFDAEDFRKTEERLDFVRGLMAKYGNTEEAVLARLDEKKKRLEELEHYDELAAEAKIAFEAQEKLMLGLCEKLSEARKKAAAVLEERIREELLDLNFLHVDFKIDVRRQESFSANGFDDVEFLISTNDNILFKKKINYSS